MNKSESEVAEEVYQRIRAAMVAQGRRAVPGSTETGIGCMYRTSEGLKCAVGCLIDDDAYDPDIEGASVSRTHMTTAVGVWAVTASASKQDEALVDCLRRSGVPANSAVLQLLMAAQWFHDSRWSNGIVWPRSAKVLVARWAIQHNHSNGF